MSKKPLKVIAGAPDRPLVIGNIKIECYVLEDETRVLSRGGFQGALGRHRTSRRHQPPDGVNLPAFLAAGNINEFISSDLATASTPVKFKAPARGPVAYGYRAELLPQVCEVYLQAQDAGVLLRSQRHIAERAQFLIRGLATVGIIALVDEVTGYQEIRDRLDLNKILDRFLLKERAKWAKRFPDDFYREIFRIKGWPWQGMKVNRPQVVGRYTNDIIWDRIAPGVREELEKRNPKNESGERPVHHHQWLTHDIGHPELQKHLIGVIALMKSVRTEHGWTECLRRIQRVFPKIGETIPLEFD